MRRRHLEQLAGKPKLVGIRHAAQDEPDDEFLLRPDFCRGIALLREFGARLRHPDFSAAPARGRNVRAPISGAEIRARSHRQAARLRSTAMEPWNKDVRALAELRQRPLQAVRHGTEARWKQWTREDFQPVSRHGSRSLWPRPAHDRIGLAGVHARQRTTAPPCESSSISSRSCRPRKRTRSSAATALPFTGCLPSVLSLKFATKMLPSS